MSHAQLDSSKWRRQFIAVEPALLVADIRAAQEYFFRSLHFPLSYGGFSYEGDEPSYCQVSRGAVGIGLHQLPRAARSARRDVRVPAGFADVVLWLANLGEYAEEIAADGAVVAEPIRVDEFGLKQMIVEDLDGHRIRLIEDQWRDDSWPPKSVT